MQDKMFCPVCRKELVVYKNLPLETSGEHICQPNEIPSMKPAYQCPDTNCPANKLGCMWDDFEGGLFWKNYPTTKEREERDSIPFIDGIKYPFGSFNRGWDAAKKAEAKANKQICQFPKWFPSILSEMKVRLDWNYKADDNGKITNRHFDLHWIRKDGVIHNWGLYMLIYCIKGDYREWKAWRKYPSNKVSVTRLQDSIRRGNWPDAEWWRIWSAKFAAFLLNHPPVNNP